MTSDQTALFGARGEQSQIESGAEFQPKFDGDGLIPAIATASNGGEILMFAWMNRDALAKSIATGTAHFWSRSRNKLWRKGEDSGNTLHINEIRVDCDQDVLWLICDVSGAGKACHTGARSCFYRRLVVDKIEAGRPAPLAPVGVPLEAPERHK